MSLYTLLRNKPKPSAKEIEECFSGTPCMLLLLLSSFLLLLLLLFVHWLMEMCVSACDGQATCAAALATAPSWMLPSPYVFPPTYTDAPYIIRSSDGTCSPMLGGTCVCVCVQFSCDGCEGSTCTKHSHAEEQLAPSTTDGPLGTQPVDSADSFKVPPTDTHHLHIAQRPFTPLSRARSPPFSFSLVCSSAAVLRLQMVWQGCGEGCVCVGKGKSAKERAEKGEWPAPPGVCSPS